MLRKIILISTLCLLATPSFATEADFEKRMARGVSALDNGNTALAREEFQAAIKEHPNDVEAALYFAIALNRAGDPSAEPALKTALRLEPGNPRINLELGTFYYNKKMYDEAGDYFENLLTQKPDPEMTAAAEGYLANIRASGGGKRWGATVMGGMQYDSNVQLVAAGGVLAPGTDRRGDWRGVLNLGFNGVAFRDNEQELTGSYSLYQTLHVHLTEFNLTQNLFDVTYKLKISPAVTAKTSGAFESIQLGGNPFVNDFSICPGVLFVLNDAAVIGLDYRFRSSYFKNSETFSGNTDRNGVTHSIILSQRMTLSEMFTLRVGYTFDREVTKVSAWSSDSHRAGAGLGVALPHALLFDISFDAASKKYDEILDPATAIRSDATITGAASLTWQATGQYVVSLGYHHTNNTSNVSGYEYSRGITSVMFEGRY